MGTNHIIKEVDTNGSSIPESASKKIFNSIVKIKINDERGTGFFMKIKIKNKYDLKFLLTCNHVISKKHLNLKIDIYYGEINDEKNIKIKLDEKERKIIFFEDPIDATLIEILEQDKISENKYLIPDLNYQNGYKFYKEKPVYLAGYPFDEIYIEERAISSGRIIDIISEIEFSHSLNTRNCSSGSPICLKDNKCVIGIHKAGDKKKK